MQPIMKRFIPLMVMLLGISTCFSAKYAKAQEGKQGFIYSPPIEQEEFKVQRYDEFNREDAGYYNDLAKQFDWETTLADIARISTLINYHEGATFAYTLLAQKSEQKEQYDSCLLYLKHALYHSSNITPNTGTTAKIYVMIGVLYDQLSKQDSACYYMYKGLENLEFGNLNFTNEQVIGNAYQVYRHIGAFWMSLNNMNNALVYLNRASTLAKLSKDHRLHHDALVSKATIYFRQNNLDSAMACYTALLKDPSVKPITRILGDENMARIYLKMPDSHLQKKSIPYLVEAYKLSKHHNYRLFILRLQSLLAAGYYCIGDYKKAEYFLTTVLNDPFKKSLGLSDLSIQHENLSKTYEALGKYKLSNEQLQEAIALQKKLTEQEEIKSINEFEFKYRAAKKDQLLAERALQVSQQQKQLQRQYMLLIGGGSGALLIICALALLLRVRKQKDEIEKLKAIMYGEEKERTRMARELHDGTVSNLSAIRLNLSALPIQHPEMKCAAEDLRKSLLLLDRNIAELRNTSHNLLPEILHQFGLAEAIRIYASNIRDLGQLDIRFVMIGQLPTLNKDFQLTVYRIIQELINNIIKHANAIHVLIQFQVMNDKLNITVDDDGNGVPFFHTQAANGIGLQNLKNRVKALNGIIEIESNKGTSVYLTFNLQPFIEKTTKIYNGTVN